jgi:hypothetical protein
MEAGQFAVVSTSLVWVDEYGVMQEVEGEPVYYVGDTHAGAVYLSGNNLEYVGSNGVVYRVPLIYEGYTALTKGQIAIDGEYLMVVNYDGDRMRLCPNECEYECQTVDETGCDPTCENVCEETCEFSCEICQHEHQVT